MSSESSSLPTSPEPLRLDQFLKRIGLVDTGGQAKVAIQGGDVLVNGVVETRRRRKLSAADVVSLDGQVFRVDAFLRGE